MHSLRMLQNSFSKKKSDKQEDSLVEILISRFLNSCHRTMWLMLKMCQDQGYLYLLQVYIFSYFMDFFCCLSVCLHAQGIKPTTLRLLAKCSIPELHHQPSIEFQQIIWKPKDRGRVQTPLTETKVVGVVGLALTEKCFLRSAMLLFCKQLWPGRTMPSPVFQGFRVRKSKQ